MFGVFQAGCPQFCTQTVDEFVNKLFTFAQVIEFKHKKFAA